jgi:hypothetical protein
MRKLNLFSKKAQLLDLQGDFSRYRKYNRIMSTFGSAISNRSIYGFDSYMDRLQKYTEAKYTVACFSELVVASAPSLFYRFDARQGDEMLMWEYRNLVLRKLGLDPNGRTAKHRILIVRKQTSMLRSATPGYNRTHFHDIYNVDEVATHLRRVFPWIPVDIVSPVDSINAEVESLQSATIVISPCGGISAMLAFLPRDSTAIIMDYFVDKSEGLGYVS